MAKSSAFSALARPGSFCSSFPSLDRRTARGQPSSLFTWIGVLMLIYIVVLTYLGYTGQSAAITTGQATGAYRHVLADALYPQMRA